METVLDQKLVSSWFDVHQSVPETYVFPPEKRPGKLNVPLCKSIPVVDLASYDRRDTIQQIFKASQDYGFFQVTQIHDHHLYCLLCTFELDG